MMNNTERHAIRLWLLAGDARPIMTIVQRRSKGPSEPVLRWSHGLPSLLAAIQQDDELKTLPWEERYREAMLDVFYDAVESLVLELEDLNPGMSQTALERTAMERLCQSRTFQTIHDTWGAGCPQLEPDVATAFSRCALDAYLEQILILTAPPVKAYLPSAECVSHVHLLASQVYSQEVPAPSTLTDWQSICSRLLPCEDNRVQMQSLARLDILDTRQKPWIAPVIQAVRSRAWHDAPRPIRSYIRKHLPPNDFDAVQALPDWTTSDPHIQDTIAMFLPDAHAALAKSGLLSEQDWKNMPLLKSLALSMSPTTTQGEMQLPLPAELEM